MQVNLEKNHESTNKQKKKKVHKDNGYITYILCTH